MDIRHFAFACCWMLPVASFAHPQTSKKLENDQCFELSSADGSEQWIKAELSACGIDKEKPSRIEYREANFRCLKHAVYVSHLGLGEIDIVYFKNYPMSSCGFDLENPSKVEFNFKREKCVKTYYYNSLNGQETLEKDDKNEFPLSACGFDLSRPTEETYSLEKGMFWNHCLKTMTYVSETGKGTLIRQTSKGIPLSACEPKKLGVPVGKANEELGNP